MAKTKSAIRFLVCVDNEAYPASLELRKVYQAMPDALAGQKGFVRVIDESDEDYWYPESCFIPIELPQPARMMFQRAS
jgi:hypothetical protein